ncbi:hypothetical protein K450DRAFT_223568 [Umbelopsis ramanniana AG]|uniref:Uncharacterized protein n=1 Tax=Umbelopsis ramanniana AG TaxID=1314678 RepID=A0AAD5EH57_UMBRA|nr:uncharacterized protein K450DRAFT_223568 [Umbelopsis ramanniana AG]KAI8583419.1 hypothetical protein K450DRAFT_223568 [Umbelopsis ramanniana AG]
MSIVIACSVNLARALIVFYQPFSNVTAHDKLTDVYPHTIKGTAKKKNSIIHNRRIWFVGCGRRARTFFFLRLSLKAGYHTENFTATKILFLRLGYNMDSRRPRPVNPIPPQVPPQPQNPPDTTHPPRPPRARSRMSSVKLMLSSLWCFTS